MERLQKFLRKGGRDETFEWDVFALG